MESYSPTKSDIAILESILHECYKFTSKTINVEPKRGFFSGQLGISFFNILFEKYYNIENGVGEDMLINSLSTSKSVNESLCNGNAGLYWLLSKLKERQFFEVEEMILLSLKNRLINSFRKEFERGNHDFLHGGFGILHTLLTSSRLTKEELEQLVYPLSKYSKKNTPTLLTPFSPINKETGINLHLAHGISSYIIVLCELYQQTGNVDIKFLIQYHMNIIIRNFELGNLSIFPYEDGNDIRIVRNAWCYGDWGIALALYHSNKIFQNKNVNDIIIEVWKHSYNRKDMKNSKIFDNPICHGVFGNLLINDTNSKISQPNTYQGKEIYKYYMETITNSFKKYGRRSLYYKTDEKFVKNDSILTGLSGIGLTCLNMMKYDTLDWKEIILLHEN